MNKIGEEKPEKRRRRADVTTSEMGRASTRRDRARSASSVSYKATPGSSDCPLLVTQYLTSVKTP